MDFVGFVMVGTFVVSHLLIAVLLNNLEEAKAERLPALEQPPVSRDVILRDLRSIQKARRRSGERQTIREPESVHRIPSSFRSLSRLFRAA